MPTGTIERLEYSHGFIKLQGGGRLFFYKSKVASPGFGQLRKGDKVEYKTGTGRDGRPAAVNVKKIVEVGHPAAEDTRATPGSGIRIISSGFCRLAAVAAQKPGSWGGCNLHPKNHSKGFAVPSSVLTRRSLLFLLRVKWRN